MDRSRSDIIYYDGLPRSMGGWTSRCHERCIGDERQFRCVRTCEPVRQEELCLLFLHETGHLLGLPDEYAEAACPDRTPVRHRPRGLPQSAMNSQHVGWEELDFLPRHLTKVLHPACPTRPVLR